MTGTDIGSLLSGIGTIILAILAIVNRAPKPPDDRPVPPPSVGRRPMVFAIASLVLGVSAIGLALIPRVIPSAQDIVLTSPPGDNRVVQDITVEGYAISALPADRYLYIIVEWGGLWWPQYDNITPIYSQITKRWEFSVSTTVGKQEDSGEIFELKTVLADALVHQQFQSWLQTKEWTGIPIAEVYGWGELELHDHISIIRE